MTRFEQFIKERQYLHNAAPRTIECYRYCFKFLPNENPTQTELNEMVYKLREGGRKETGVNFVIRTLNGYLHWVGGREGPCGSGCNHPKLRKLKEPKVIMPTFTAAQISTLIKLRPRNAYERRLHLLILFLLDTGGRISEVLNVRVADIDLDNMLVLLDGKGRKQRVVPFSPELRRHIFKRISELDLKPDSLLFATGKGTRMQKDNALRAVRQLCRDLHFEPPARTLHAFRHTFAVNYLRRGGSTFHLQKSLGHSTLEMTRRYANLTTDDLSAVHQKVSLLHTL
jgi:Site-specific recombinase XerD